MSVSEVSGYDTILHDTFVHTQFTSGAYEVNVAAGSNILVGGNSITVYTFLPDFSNVVQYKICVLSTTTRHTFLKRPVLAARELFRRVRITSCCIFFRRVP